LDPSNRANHYSSNQSILVAIDYATKWMEVKALCTNIVIVTAKFLYDHILTQFGCPLTIVTNQGTRFIYDVTRYLINHFILGYTSSIIYYPQGNEQVKSINKVFETLFTKLMNENQND